MDMEAALAERKEAEMTEWTDGRLDDLGKRVDRVKTKMDAGFAGLDRRWTTALPVLRPSSTSCAGCCSRPPGLWLLASWDLLG
jgi:hypothetical protein